LGKTRPAPGLFFCWGWGEEVQKTQHFATKLAKHSAEQRPPLPPPPGSATARP